MVESVLAFTISLGAALLLTPAVRAAARRHGFVARPTADRWHSQPTALMGGVAIHFALLIGVLGAGVLAIVIDSSIAGGVVAAAVALATGRVPGLSPQGMGVLLATTLMFFTGLADDRFRLKPATKLVLQTIGAAIIVAFGVIYPLTPSVPLNVLFTVFWFLGITNALNLLDNMDGVAVGVAAVAGIFLALTFQLAGASQLAMLCAAMAGAALGFLRYNFHPASIFMGDSGSLALGALIASLGAAYPGTVSVGIVPVLFVPVFVAAIPILDTLLVTTTRTLAGRPVSVGGRDHTTHRLYAMGLSERQVALLLHGFAAGGGALALGLSRANAGLSGWLGILFLVGLGLLAAYLGRMYTYQEGERTLGRRVTVLVSDLLHKRRAFEVLLDLLLFAAAYAGAYLLRWDGRLPLTQEAVLERTLVVAIACKSAAFALVGVYRGVWQRTSLPDLHRIARGSAVGSLLTIAALVLFFRTAEYARSILIMDMLLTAVLTGSARLSFRSLDLVRFRNGSGGRRVLVYGAGMAGELLVREFAMGPGRMLPIGFVDDDPAKHGRMVQGLPVLGAGDRVPELLLRHAIQVVTVAASDIDPARLERVARACDAGGIELLRFQCVLRPFQEAERPQASRLAGE